MRCPVVLQDEPRPAPMSAPVRGAAGRGGRDTTRTGKAGITGGQVLQTARWRGAAGAAARGGRDQRRGHLRAGLASRPRGASRPEREVRARDEIRAANKNRRILECGGDRCPTAASCQAHVLPSSLARHGGRCATGTQRCRTSQTDHLDSGLAGAISETPEAHRRPRFL